VVEATKKVQRALKDRSVDLKLISAKYDFDHKVTQDTYIVEGWGLQV
jgi:hypothetical protein